MSDDIRGLPEGYRLPHEPMNFQITPFFKVMPVLNVAQSEIQGREIRDLKEVVELRFAGDRNYSPVHLAEEMSHKVGDKVITFAERFSDQYRAFLEGNSQLANGTALEELRMFGITDAQLSLCRAVKVYSIEALDNLDGPNLKVLGMNANALKDMARRYMSQKLADVAKATDVDGLRKEIERLRALIPAHEASIEEKDAALEAADDEFAVMSDEELKAYLANQTGARPRGNPSHDTLVRMAREVAA